MVGILLMTHAPLGEAFLAAVAHVFRNKVEHLEAIDVVADQDLSDVQALAAAAIRRLDDGSGVLVITDVKGGTPANCCNKLADAGHVEVIAGISLPMLLRAITYRMDTLDVVVEMALAGAQSGAVRVDNRIRVN
ncbi:PTS fructose transporter subunit IIA [Pseudoduganella sp. SL102]|uniref:PTS fructose transporter subunit IIA n=1 Tax=Pseudoduganella albidiflava TaxID=321983 RepID=A0A411X3V4_9BURK|nr:MULTISPECIES: PTS fructose transporter subunit IIA [Pseudoduganella]QBI03689.1 PTS fructose transporter subunit IIA [Pseudoduganella albidiflava]WBS03773.1 PTS fructose transporter subunit IIA [Pseudoduganella sp. SL102]GGY69691.1 PTS mannose transporter subunit IIA [Pseudoduganella albidiflava]